MSNESTTDGDEMPDTLRSTFPEKFCAWCGKGGGCYLKHWGPLMRGAIVYLDECAVELRSVSDEGVEPRFDCDTGGRSDSKGITNHENNYRV